MLDARKMNKNAKRFWNFNIEKNIEYLIESYVVKMFIITFLHNFSVFRFLFYFNYEKKKRKCINRWTCTVYQKRMVKMYKCEFFCAIKRNLILLTEVSHLRVVLYK